LADDGIFKTCGLKSFIPIVDTCNDVGAPLLRRSRINIINDGSFWFNQFSPFIPFNILRFWLEPVTDNECPGVYALLSIAVFEIVIGEIANTPIKTSWHHWLLRH